MSWADSGDTLKLAVGLDGEEASLCSARRSSRAGVALMSISWATVSGLMNSPAVSWPEMMSSRTCAPASSLSRGRRRLWRVGSPPLPPRSQV